MNRVIRSPDISQTPVVISVKPSGGTALLTGEAEDFLEVGPHLDDTSEQLAEDPEASTEQETEGPTELEASEAASSVGPETELAAPEPKDPPRSLEFGPVPPAVQGGPLSEEEGEMMIGMEEIAERDAAAAAGGEATIGVGASEGLSNDTSEATEEPLPTSASEIEAIVEARLKEFEERFQQEKEDAYHAGFEDGTNEGTKQGLSQSEDEVGRFQTTVDTLTAQWKDTLKTYDTAVTDLAIKIAQKIISVEIDQNNDAVLQAVHDCLAYVEDKTKVTIRVNPDDLEAVRRHRNDWLQSLESIDHLLIESEPSVSRGGCIVETPIGDVDAQIEERLERLRIVLLEEINRTDTGQET